MQSNFEESILDIAGLTHYEPGVLPPWFRAILLECSYEDALESIPDCDLVSRNVAAYGVPWLNAWGTANVAGQPVFVCQSDGLTEPICLAADLECGLVLVEPGEMDDIGYTLFFVEKFRGQSRVPIGDSSPSVTKPLRDVLHSGGQRLVAQSI